MSFDDYWQSYGIATVYDGASTKESARKSWNRALEEAIKTIEDNKDLKK